MPGLPRVVVLGGSGFVGSHLTSALSTAAWRVFVVTRSRARARHLLLLPTVEVIQADPQDGAAMTNLFRGADAGKVEGSDEPVRFERSLTLDEARTSDVLLAYAMNGEPLPTQHGFPLRALVPRKYFWKSAKWLEAIEVTGEDHLGFWERNGYHNEADPWKEERFSDW